MLVVPPGQSFPHTSYFSVQPALAWILNHYVYPDTHGPKHYVWASRFLFPYRRRNPKSSNPLEILRDLYQPCVDRDAFDAFIAQKRINVRTGVEAVVRRDPTHAFHKHLPDLLHICDRIDITFFWPLVYVIDHNVATSRGKLANSALVGSDERLIPDLREKDFALLIPDYDRESPLSNDIAGFIGNAFPTALDAVKHLRARA